jgi:hypothetical protein
MLNRAVYQKDPSTRKLVNEGVASVNDDRSENALNVLRYELETFVCDGQYARGLEHILRTYIANLAAMQQPAVWVSGFFGSGKSHMVKMARALWADTVFADGATARGLAHLPVAIRDLLAELSIAGKRGGGLHAAAGTLGASAEGSVRLAILSIVFKSAGLPQQYPQARFVMWLRHEGILEQVQEFLEQEGYDWQEELDNFYVAEGLPAALVAAKPHLFGSSAACLETLRNQHPHVTDVTSDEMVKAIRQALATDGKFPLTLLVLDEVQQFIGNDPQRANEVQEAVEACCKNIGAHLLVIATGQTAVTGTAQLAKLQGRFTIRVELSDADVDAVVRQVILAKQPTAIGVIDQVMTTNLGEVARHLAGTTLAHRQDDIANFAKDYPILPVRRRFWEQALRALDPTGTDSQLRNQLTMVHKAVQTNLDQPVGSVIAADYLYFDSVDRLLQARILPRNVRDETVRLHASADANDQLTARAVGLIFLINKLTSHNKEMGMRATVDTLADLMVIDLAQGSSTLRSRLPALLDASKLLMRVGDEYRIQTDESRAWNDEFAAQVNQIANDSHSIETERNSRLRARFAQVAGKLTRLQGSAKTPRSPQLIFDAELPADASDRLYVWVRSGWTVDQASFHADARQAGAAAPTVFVFLPRRSGDDLRTQIINYKAAANTLDKRGDPNSPEGIEARAAIETIRQTADRRINELVGEILSTAHVYQGGGAEVFGETLTAAIEEALDSALVRLYSEFRSADQTGWEQAYTRAQKGAADSLRAIGYLGEPGDHPVCKKVLALIGAGKRGEEVRKTLDAAPYGWPRDAIDGALQVLLVANLVRASDDQGRPVAPATLERKAIGRTLFRVEATIITVPQRLELRKLFTLAAVPVTAGEESAAAARYVTQLEALAASAGGDAPKPAPPATNWLQELRLAAGNAQLLAIYNQREELAAAFTGWTETARAIAARWPAWQTLQRLVAHLDGVADAEIIRTQAAQIRQHRQLLTTPDLIQPLIDGATQLLRTALNTRAAEFEQAFAAGETHLTADANWQQLTPAQQATLRQEFHLTPADLPAVEVGSPAAVLATLDALPLTVFDDRIAALPGRVADLRKAAAKLVAPQTQFVSIPRPTIRNAAELDNWLAEVKQAVATALEQGPVNIG